MSKGVKDGHVTHGLACTLFRLAHNDSPTIWVLPTHQHAIIVWALRIYMLSSCDYHHVSGTDTSACYLRQRIMRWVR